MSGSNPDGSAVGADSSSGAVALAVSVALAEAAGSDLKPAVDSSEIGLLTRIESLQPATIRANTQVCKRLPMVRATVSAIGEHEQSAESRNDRWVVAETRRERPGAASFGLR